MPEINLLDLYPRSRRPIEERGKLVTGEHRKIARQFGKDYFDGERLYGYGGYKYHPKFWAGTVKRFRDYYNLNDNARILDVGCGKGFMMYDFKKLMPNIEIIGLDISQYAYDNAVQDMKPYIIIGSAEQLPFVDNYFDLVISINTIHNLALERCRDALREIQRVTSNNAFITVDAWRNEVECSNLLKWNLTAQTYMHVNDWLKIFEETGYKGDYYWFIAE